MHTSEKGYTTKKILVILLALVVAASIGFALYKAVHKPTTSKVPGLNLKPATKEEQQQAQDHKKEIVDREIAIKQSASDSTSTAQQAAITISSADSASVRAYLPGVFEDDGICTATVTKDGQTITKSSTGFKNVSYTQCAPIKWDSPLSAGMWNMVFSYKSVSAQGSVTKVIEVN
jgi:uncharacterized protein YxeA